MWAIADSILEGRINWVAFGIGLGTLMVILLLKDSKRLPGILIAVVAATAVVGALDLGTGYGVAVLGPLPEGLPAFAIPWITYGDIVPVLVGGCAIALVSFADASVLSRAYAARLAHVSIPIRSWSGLARPIWQPAFFRVSRSAAALRVLPLLKPLARVRQLTSVVGALAIAVLLLVAPSLLQHLPTAALAAVVIAAAIGLFEITDLKRIYRI